ncbi:Glyoxylate reductase 1 [Apiospora kogelbergensis]|uniref:Glyoxylate reductase 1 n=1 Tax=Apiospora kogelbergensis TaxID=1337665 RepID=A0AAW0R4R9_9PEZI
MTSNQTTNGATDGAKPVVLHLGDPIKYNTDIYQQLQETFTIISPSVEERQRPVFLQCLREGKWGEFAAVFRPWWATGGEIGRIDRELVSLLPKSLKVWASAGAGYDWADVDVMAERGILYCNGALASSEAVADMAIYHIISVFRNMQWSNMAGRANDPDAWTDAHINAQFTARNPQGHVLGIVGLGNIGYRIAVKAFKAFDMRITYYDPFPKSAAQESAIHATRCASMEELLAGADCVILAAPGGSGKLMTQERIAQMKQGSRLVNIARGSLVDEEAVAAALETGHLSAVGLDVFENEPRPNPKLASKRNATLTCHTAGGALETAMGFEGLSMKNVLAVLAGQPPLTPVNQHLIEKHGQGTSRQ